MQRRRLLAAIVEIVGEGGFESASVARVCQRAGVSRRTFYEVFDDRERCLTAAFDTTVERLSVPVLAAYENGGAWCERIRSALVVLLEIFDAEPYVARLCLVESLKTPVVLERRARVLAVMVSAVERARRAGSDRAGAGPPPLTGEGVVGGVLAVIQARVLARTAKSDPDRNGGSQGFSSLVELAAPLMAMIVHPYLGPAAARRELERPTPTAHPTSAPASKDPFDGLPIRVTYRTARVLATIAELGGPGSYPSNRLVANTAGIADIGQASRLLKRLQHAGLIENRSHGKSQGEANAWRLTPHGEAVNATLTGG
jgi:AcrR family transcriptional regulator